MKPSQAAVLAFFVMIIAQLGFYQTYLKNFPDFNGVLFIHHFHGAMMMTWFVLLIIQPLLIKFKKQDWHRRVGKLSYVVAPLLVFSIYLVTRNEYYDDVAQFTTQKSLAGLDFDLTSMFTFIVLYSLAIYHRKNMVIHVQYMICTALLIVIPGLGRLFGIGLALPGPVVGMSIIALTYGSYFALIFFERRKNHSVTPYLVGAGLMTFINFTIFTNTWGWWQSTAGVLAKILF